MIIFRLSRILGEKKLKVADLSRMTGISEISLGRLYHGADRIRFDTLDKICKALNCRVDELIEYVPDAPELENKAVSAPQEVPPPKKKRGLFGFS